MDNLLDTIERHLAETGQSPSAFGRAVKRNPTFVFDLRNGRDYTSKTAKQVEAYIASFQEGATQ